MNKALFHTVLLSTLLLSAGCGGPVNPQGYVRKAVSIMDRTALYAEGDEWEEAKEKALSAAPETMDAAYDVVREALKTAGGKHSFLIPQPEVSHNENAQWPMPAIDRTEDGIPVVSVPHFAGNQKQALTYAGTLQNGIPDDASRIILDLRGNTGGNMYPMIAGVNALLPDGIIIKFRNKFGRETPLTSEFVARNQGVARKLPISPWIAILTDGATASSGEALLICFRGMTNVRTFGSPTAGYASGNQTFHMKDGSCLVVTASCDVARTGEVFCDDPIIPDTITATPMEDALTWLRESH